MPTPRLAAALMLVLACGGRPTFAAPPTTAQDVSALIAKVDADDGRDRDAAAAALAAGGEAVRPAVADAAHSPSAEVRSRAAAAVAKLDDLDRDRPTRVRLHLHHADPLDALAKLQAQVGVPVYLSGQGFDPGHWTPEQPGITIDVAGQPFWSVMADVCRHVEWTPGGMARDGGISVTRYQEDALAGPWSTDGPFVIVARRAGRLSGVPWVAPPNVPPSDAMQFALFADPKAHVLLINPTATLTEATDDRGRSLLAGDRSDAGHADGRPKMSSTRC